MTQTFGMLQRACGHRHAARLILRRQQHAGGQIVHLTIAQRQNAGDTTVHHAIAALVAAAKHLAQFVRKQAAPLTSGSVFETYTYCTIIVPFATLTDSGE